MTAAACGVNDSPKVGVLGAGGRKESDPSAGAAAVLVMTLYTPENRIARQSV